MKQATIWIPVVPVPASRPRVSKWGTYYGPVYKRFKAAMAEWLSANALPVFFEDEELKVDITVTLKKPKTSQRMAPRGDVDNYFKAVTDALNGHLWSDDVQIVEASITKEYGDKQGIMLYVRDCS